MSYQGTRDGFLRHQKGLTLPKPAGSGHAQQPVKPPSIPKVKSPSSIEGAVDPATRQNVADVARTKMQSGGSLGSQEIESLKWSSDNALNTLPENMIKTLTGKSKTELMQLRTTDPESYVRLLGM